VTASFRLAYVPGVTPGKWARIWEERLPQVSLLLDQVPASDALALVHDREVDAALLRLPIDRTGVSAIPLYTETSVVVIPKDHLLAVADEVSVADVADEVLLHPEDDTLDWADPPGRPALQRPGSTKDAIELVAAGVGLVVVPQSLARLHHRRDITYRPVTFAPESQVALTWPADETTDLVEEFIGIVRGRTVNSTRGRPQPLPLKKKKTPAAARSGTESRRRTTTQGKRRNKRR
jgi:DNA-binding transcriptional LysR family regulator